MALLKAAISWQPCCSSSEGYLCTRIGSADLLSVKVWDARGPCNSYRKANFLFRWILLEKGTLSAWDLSELPSCYISKFVPFMGRYIVSPQVPLPTALGGLLGLCPTPMCRLLGAGLTADRLHCRVSSCGKHSCNHSSQ